MAKKVISELSYIFNASQKTSDTYQKIPWIENTDIHVISYVESLQLSVS